MNDLAIYIHWPFCVSKCPYCDFASRPLPDALDEARLIEAYRTELASYRDLLGERRITSIYFGGGTPSLMRPSSVATLIEACQKSGRFAEDCEITLEANPSSSESEKFKAFRAAGINRLSLGVQSFDDEALRFYGRAHDAVLARRAIEAAAKTFERFSFDLIYARAGQDEKAWRTELREALSFAPRHLSLYQLSVEPGTPFYKKEKKVALRASEERAADLFEITQAVLEQAGLPAYEISNHAIPGQESRHNLTYWHYGDYIGIGPSAHGRFVAADGVRYASENERWVAPWLAGVQSKGQGRCLFEKLDQQTAQTEALLMGLRLRAGLHKEKWQNLFQLPVDDFLSKDKRRKLIDEGLLCETNEIIAATAQGREKLNAVLAYLLQTENRI